MRLTILVALIAAPAAAQERQQFDLKCVGTEQNEIDGKSVASEYGFRIDLEAKRWCWANCQRVFEIVQVLPDRIVLTDENEDSYSRRRSAKNEVDRVSGEHRQVSINIRPYPSYYNREGQCEATEFSGFPQARF